MLTIVIPMAGSGSRFTRAGYTMPKPLVPIFGVPLIQFVINNLRPQRTPHRFIFICQQEHLNAYGLEHKLKAWAGENAMVTAVNGLTEGAACTVLTIKDQINNNAPLMIANCDQYVDTKIDDYLADMEKRQLDGLIMTLTSGDPKWSYAAVNDQGYVTRVAEKVVISANATVGIYNYRQASDFVQAAEDMIAKNLRYKNEFYIAPAYDQFIARGKKVGIHPIGGEMNGMYGLGTPEDLQKFLAMPIAQRVASSIQR
jgi:dTDP-glucose pyrophosphorylase